MKTKIFSFLLGCLFIVSCSEDFITKDFDKGRYIPSTFYNTKDHAIQALNAAYSTLNDFGNGYNWTFGIMRLAYADDLYQTGYAAGFGTWGPTSDFNTNAAFSEVREVWSASNANILKINVALQVMPEAQAAAKDATFTQEVLDLYMGQAYFLRALNYYNLFTSFPEDKIVLRRTVPQTDADFAQAPAPADSIYNFIISDLTKAKALLTKGLNTTTGYEKGRVTRGAAAALLGKTYMYRQDYAKAAAEFKLILPGVGDAAYGTYQLVDSYRDNHNKTGENNKESIFEVQYDNITKTSGFGGNEVNWLTQNYTLNRTSWPDMWFNFAVPTYKLDEFENWTETIDGVPTTVYDYRVYSTFWGVPNGAKFTYKGTVKDWVAQGWDKESVAGKPGAFGIRKMALDNSDDFPVGADASWSEINVRVIRLADVMLLYAECMANINSGNVTPTDANSAIYWVDKVRERANKPNADQAHLYSARPGVQGQLPTATALKNAKGWTLMQLIEHERLVEGYCEGWRKEDLKRWKKGVDAIKDKAGWKGYESLTLPVPQRELDNNPNMK